MQPCPDNQAGTRHKNIYGVVVALKLQRCALCAHPGSNPVRQLNSFGLFSPFLSDTTSFRVVFQGYAAAFDQSGTRLS